MENNFTNHETILSDKLDNLISILQTLISNSSRTDLIQLHYVLNIAESLRKFCQNFDKGNTNADEFYNIHELETLLTSFSKRQSLITKELFADLVMNIDESDLIDKKKLNIFKKA
jgi:hypothetical protein